MKQAIKILEDALRYEERKAYEMRLRARTPDLSADAKAQMEKDIREYDGMAMELAGAIDKLKR